MAFHWNYKRTELCLYVYDVFFVIMFITAICKCEVAYVMEKETKKLFRYLQVVFVLFCIEGVFKTGFEIATSNLVTGSLSGSKYVFYSVVTILILAMEDVFIGLCFYRYTEKKISYYYIIPIVVLKAYEIFTVFQKDALVWDLTGKSANVVCIMSVFLLTAFPLNPKQGEEKLNRQRKFYKLLVVYFVGAILENVIFCLYRTEWRRIIPFYEDRIHWADDIFCIILVIKTIKLANREIEEYNRLQIENIVKQRIYEYEQEHAENKNESKEDAIKAFCQQYGMTKREVEILFYILDGKGNQEIADLLYISIGTVKAHVHSVFHKMEVSRRSQVIKKYIDYNKENS